MKMTIDVKSINKSRKAKRNVVATLERLSRFFRPHAEGHNAERGNFHMDFWNFGILRGLATLFLLWLSSSRTLLEPSVTWE